MWKQWSCRTTFLPKCIYQHCFHRSLNHDTRTITMPFSSWIAILLFHFAEMVYEKDVPIGESIVSLDILDTAGNVSSWPLSLWSCDWIHWLHFKMFSLQVRTRKINREFYRPRGFTDNFEIIRAAVCKFLSCILFCFLVVFFSVIFRIWEFFHLLDFSLLSMKWIKANCFLLKAVWCV